MVVAARAVVVAGLALSLGACSQSADLLMGSSAAPEPAVTKVATSAAPTRSELEKATEHWGKEHAKSPRDGKAAVNYARNLRELGRTQEALATLQSSYLYNAQNREYLSEFGRLALEQDQPQLAQQLLERADDPANPDWRILSARGAAMAKQGQYKAAIPFFERARELAPQQASVISNLALAYTMDGHADRAEPLLKQAATMADSDPRVRQNLALVLRLQGKEAEATSVAMGGDQRPQAAPFSVATTTGSACSPAGARCGGPPPRERRSDTGEEGGPRSRRRDPRRGGSRACHGTHPHSADRDVQHAAAVAARCCSAILPIHSVRHRTLRRRWRSTLGVHRSARPWCRQMS